MRFRLLDRIIDLRAGETITAVRKLIGDEEYLQDHFPLFPVMPGALMLEALFQASAWLVRVTEDFSTAVVWLKEVRSTKFQGFVQPGEELHVAAEIVKHDDTLTTLKAKGTVNNNTVVVARLVLERFNLADRYPPRAKTDYYMRRKFRAEFRRLYAGVIESVC